MAAQDCIDEIKRAAPNLLDDELDEILTGLQRRLDARKAEGQLASLDEALFNAADEFAREVEEAVQLERRNRLINLRKFDDMMSFADRVDQETGDPSLAVRSRNVGINTRVLGARNSVDARGQALIAEYLGGMIADLRRENLLPIFNSRQLDREIARELAEISKRPENRNVGVSQSDEAVKIAAIVDKYRRMNVARENRAGAWIKPLEGHIVRQSHDMFRMRRAGFEEWRRTIEPLLDAVRTFRGADPEPFLRAAYDGLISGRHIISNGADEADTLLAFKGPGNLAKRVSQHRVLHFKDADAWVDYNQVFGRSSLVEAIFHDFERSARNTALMEAWGPNPRAMFERVMDELKDKHRGDTKKFDRLQQSSIQNQFDEVEGITRVPVNPTSAHVTASILAVESMAKLGGAALSSFGDLGFKAATIADATGDNLLSVWGRNLESTLEGVAPGERRATAELIGVGMDGQIGEIASRFSAQDDLPGRMAKMQQMFFKLNLLGPWTDANKRGLGLMFSRDLAMNANRSWGDLPQAEILRLFDFDERKWNAVRQAVRKEADGREYLMPDAVRDIPDETLTRIFAADTPTTRRGLQRIRDDLETSLRAYFVDAAEEAVPTPGARERAILRQGTRPGTPVGIAARLIGQFKAFPTTVLTKVAGRRAQADTVGQFFRNLTNGTADIQGLVHMMVATTVLGYMAQSAKEIAKGKSPRDPTSAATWTAAMLQGGGLGIYGDFLFGEFNRFGRSALETAAGPSLGTAADIIDLFARVRAGEDAAAQALRLAVGNSPFANLFYTRVAFDYLFLFQLQEALNPGFLRRAERRIERENNQTFILPPSQAIPFGGGDRLLEGVR